MNDQADDESEGEAGGGFDMELVRSYAAFGWRAVRQRWVPVSIVFFVGAVLTALASIYYPRSYNCTTVLMGQGSSVLEGWQGAGASPFSAAGSLIKRHENLEQIIRDTGQVQKFKERRPPLLGLKDRILASAFGEVDDETMVSVLVGTLESRLWIGAEWNTLTVSVDWSDGKTAAELAEAARESFVRSRHASEMSAFQEKMAILEGHSAKLREEIETIAQQITSRREEKVAKATSQSQAATSAAAQDPEPRRIVVRRPAAPDERLPELRAELANKKQRLGELEADRERRIRESQAKIADLKLRLTPSHPEVINAEQRHSLLAQVPSEILLLRSEVKSLEDDLEQRESLGKAGTVSVVSRGQQAAAQAGGTGEPLPTEIMALLDEENTDPILSAQLHGAVSKYGALRDGIRSGRIELDTAQAAANHRYRVVVPAATPSKPSKPKVLMIWGGGLAASLALALLLALIGELKTGVIVERWQVQQVRLPILADLKLPPRSAD